MGQQTCDCKWDRSGIAASDMLLLLLLLLLLLHYTTNSTPLPYSSASSVSPSSFH